MMNLTGKIFYITGWGTSILLIGLLIGAMTILFPPMASIGVVALMGVCLLWALPELKFVPEKLLRKMFFILVIVQLCVPNYYAIETGYLPWISVRKVFALAVIVLFSLTVAGSMSARTKIMETLSTNRLLAFLVLGFLAMMFLSIFTSVNRPESLKAFFDALLGWYIPLFACILIVRNEQDIRLLFAIIAIAAIFDSGAGLIEFFLERRYYFDVMPKAMLDSMLSNNPALAAMYYIPLFRNGMYRANSIYSVSLSFGELGAMVGPISAYFLFHGRNWREWILGGVTGISSLITLFCSGARGSYTAFLVSMAIMLFLWTVRNWRLNPHSLVTPIMAVIFAFGSVFIGGLIAFWPRLHNLVLGGGYAEEMSTESRFEQWDLALPHIFSNPVTGHGVNMGGTVIGYHNENSVVFTVDSYIISLLVEVGVPGFLFFFGMILVAIWIGLRFYLMDSDERMAIAGPVACSLIAFAIYRTVLSQAENHTLLFLIIGLVFAIGKLAYDRRFTTGFTIDNRVRSPGATF